MNVFFGDPRFVPPNLAGLAPRVLSKEGFVIALPCLLSTAVLAPFFIMLLETEARKLPSQAISRSVLYGIGFGMLATFVTCVIALLLSVLKEPASSAGVLTLKLFGGVVFGVLGAPAFIFWCFPFILISGAFFGIMNLVLVRTLGRHSGVSSTGEA